MHNILPNWCCIQTRPSAAKAQQQAQIATTASCSQELPTLAARSTEMPTNTHRLQAPKQSFFAMARSLKPPCPSYAATTVTHHDGKVYKAPLPELLELHQRHELRQHAHAVLAPQLGQEETHDDVATNFSISSNNLRKTRPTTK